LLAVFMLLAALGQPPDLPPVVTAGSVGGAPEIDGDMGDACWQEAAVVAPLVLLGSADLPTQRTVARVAADADHVYVGFWCWEDAMDRLRTQAAGPDSPGAWADDCVEVFLAPGGKAEVYYHVIVTAQGLVYDEMRWRDGGRADTGWSFGGQAAARRVSRGWTCEMAIPRYTLGAPAIGGAWLANFARGEQPHGEWSSWPALVNGFHETARFGRLLWADRPAVTQLRLDPILMGENRLSAALSEGLDLRLLIRRDDRAHPKPLVAGDQDWRFCIDEEGEGYLRLEAWEPPRSQDETPRLAFATPPVRFSLPIISAPLAVADERLRRAAEELAPLRGPGVKAVAARLRALRMEQARLGADLAVAKLRPAEGPEEWTALLDRATRQRRDAFVALAHARAVARARGAEPPPFGLGWQSALLKLHPDDDRVNLGGTVQLSAARDEWESVQLVVLPLTDDVRIEAVELSALKDARSGKALPADAARLWRVGYVVTRQPVYPVEYVGSWPDPLLPLEPFEVRAGELQPLWISLYVPPGTVPGTYCGQVRVTAEGGATASWPLQLRVWDLTLPRPSRLKTAFSILQRYDACRWYGFEGLPPPDFRLRLHELLLEHRLNPASLYTSEMWPPREDLQWCVERGLNALNLRTVDSDKPEVIGYVREQAAWLREHGWLPLAYVYGFDEVAPDRYDDVVKAFSAVRQAVPELRRACTVAPNDRLEGTVDVWVPLTAAYDPKAAEQRRRAGDEVWWYICCGPWHPYCNWFIDYPATDARVLFWQTHKYGVTGLLYYEVAMWRTNLITEPSADGTQIPPADERVRDAIAAGKRWPDVPWNTFTFGHYNGDGLLVYPGRDQTPLPSLRLEVIRDGIEDYDLLSVLRETRDAVMASPRAKAHRDLLALASQLLAVRPGIVRDLTHYTTDPQALLREREAVASAILRLQRALAPAASASAPGRDGHG